MARSRSKAQKGPVEHCTVGGLYGAMRVMFAGPRGYPKRGKRLRTEVQRRLAALLSPWEVDRLGAGWEAQLQSDALTGCRLNPRDLVRTLL